MKSDVQRWARGQMPSAFGGVRWYTCSEVVAEATAPGHRLGPGHIKTGTVMGLHVSSEADSCSKAGPIL